jgi:hypothetical protein
MKSGPERRNQSDQSRQNAYTTMKEFPPRGAYKSQGQLIFFLPYSGTQKDDWSSHQKNILGAN